MEDYIPEPGQECGKPMVNMLDKPDVCGRPAYHTGHCMNNGEWKIYIDANRKNGSAHDDVVIPAGD